MRIKTQITIAVACILVIMLIIIYSLYAQTSRIVIHDNDQYSEDTIRKFKLSLSQKTDEIGQIMLNLGFDPFVQKYLNQNDPSLSYEMGKELDRKIISLKAGRKGFEDIVLIGKLGTKYSLNGGIEYVRQLEPEIQASKSAYVSGLKKFNYSNNLQNSMVFAQNIYSIDMSAGADGKQIGYIAVIVNVDSMFFDIDNASGEPGVGFYLIDRYGKIFPETHSPDIARSISALSRSPGEERKLTDYVGGVKGAIQIQKLDPIQASVLSFVPEEALLAELSSVRTRSILIVILALIMMALPFAMIVNNILQPIQILVKFINSIKSGSIKDLKLTLKLEGNVEMAVVAEKLNGMLGEIDALTHKLVETTTHLLEAEIEKEKAATAYLRSQINPHFLYNTLESIKGVALEVGAPQVVDMTKALGRLFHYSIKGSGYVTLDQELNAVKSYVFLQLIRFEGRFEVKYDFTEAALRVPVMKMILQPLVENAIFHGLEPKTSKGHLTISGEVAKENGATLVVRIQDDGVGLESERLELIQSKLLEKPSALSRDGQDLPDNDSIGLLNVNNRLRLAYGPGNGISFESETGKGTRITLTMPVETRLSGGNGDV
ncbi:sensor histidine kinase [Cohnella endophytica]|uniref:Sensor histidine kinase n=1 Tax=Cohnella endophytica TaxID=2419778 RepID=A0A494XAV8_9BACL|nr:sensor histidine kinase [Cohnella endophytica]RKP46771.1 sensor histidine kinase [Cohnella endophytica]